MEDIELEKKAKLYADEHYDDTDEYGYWFSDIEMLRRAYIAGAKENGIIWHNLKTNPNDLPEEFDTIIKAFGLYPGEKNLHIVLNQDGEYVHYLSGEWYYIYDEDIIGDSPRADVIAWCEVPKFEVKNEN